MITIKVTLYPPLREQKVFKTDIDIAVPATVRSLLQLIDIKEKEIESIYINGKEGTFSQPLIQGDSVLFLPPIGGG